ncbi:DUF72 domain-containing protein [Acidobacteriota bacterium]
MAKYYYGTAGWSYKDWEGVVYPVHKKSGFHALVFLAQYINLIEVNSTFYRPPAAHISLSWIKKVENFPEFLFTVKLLQLFTHDRKSYTQKDIDMFKLGIEPLRARQKLAAILIQFPWSFASTTAHYEHLESLFKAFAGFPLALEIRHSTWDSPQFYDFLREHSVAYCNIDQPVFRNSIKPSALATNSEFSYVRLHGRNYENWFKKDAGRDARYDYLYKADELNEWVKKIKELGQNSKNVYVVTNNHYQGQALANSLQIKNMISDEKVDLPLSLLKKYPVLEEIISKIREGQLDLFGQDLSLPLPPGLPASSDKGEKN